MCSIIGGRYPGNALTLHANSALNTAPTSLTICQQPAAKSAISTYQNDNNPLQTRCNSATSRRAKGCKSGTQALDLSCNSLESVRPHHCQSASQSMREVPQSPNDMLGEPHIRRAAMYTKWYNSRSSNRLQTDSSHPLVDQKCTTFALVFSRTSAAIQATIPRTSGTDQTGNDQETGRDQTTIIRTTPTSDTKESRSTAHSANETHEERPRNNWETSEKGLLVTKSNEEKRIATTKKRASNYQIINKSATASLQNGNKQPATRQQTPDRQSQNARTFH